MINDHNRRIRIYPSHSNAYQTKILKESTILDNNINDSKNYIMHEGVMIPCDYKDAIKKFIISESKNVKEGIDQLCTENSSISLVNDGKLSVSMKTDEGTMVLFTESKIQEEINQFLKRL